MLEKINKLNLLLVEWYSSGKVQRFGQFLESKTSLQLPQNIYNENDSYIVFDYVMNLIEEGKEF